jgi:hypothetical protein
MAISGFNLFYPRIRIFDDNGDPVAGAYAKFFQSGTTTPTPIYADGACVTALGTKVTSNAAGIFPAMYGNPSVVLRMQIYSAESSPGADDGVLISDDDPIHPHVASPTGTLAIFHGDATARDAAYPPALWEVCDGDNGTPDMRDRGPVGVSSTKSPGTSGGSTGDVETEPSGTHTHTGNTGATGLDSTNMPKHGHRLWAWDVNGSNSSPDGFGIPGFDVSITGELAAGGAYIASNAFGTTLVEETGEDPGSVVAHDHTIASDGSHTHIVAGAQSPYVAVWFLMRK